MTPSSVPPIWVDKLCLHCAQVRLVHPETTTCPVCFHPLKLPQEKAEQGKLLLEEAPK